MDFRIIPLLDTTGDIHYFIEWAREITRLKKSEESLRRQKNLLTGVIDNLPDVLTIQSADHTIERLNRAGCELFGISSGEAVGKKCYELFGRKQECDACPAGAVIATGKTQEVERDVSELGLTMNSRVSPVANDKGNVVKLVMQLRDITARKQAEEKLKANYRLLRIAGQAAKIGGWSLDLKENRVQWSEEVAAIHEMTPGYSPLVSEAVDFYAPQWRSKIAQVFRDCAKQGIFYDEEMEIITRTGKRVWIRTIGEAVMDDDGNIVQVRGAIQDISAQMKAEKQQQKLENQLRQAQKLESVGRLAGGVAHDFNNMLTIINGYAEMMAEVLDPRDPIYDNLGKIQDAGRRSAIVVRKLLAFARKQTIAPEPHEPQRQRSQHAEHA